MRKIYVAVIIFSYLGGSVHAMGDVFGPHPLYSHACSGNFKGVLKCLDDGFHPDIMKSVQGLTPLISASTAGHLEVVKLLLKRGANIHFTDHFGQSAIHRAVEFGRREVIELLLAHGANINEPTSGGAFARGYTPLHRAAINGSREGAECALSKGASVDAQDNYGHTPLDLAKHFGHQEVVALLISR